MSSRKSFFYFTLIILLLISLLPLGCEITDPVDPDQNDDDDVPDQNGFAIALSLSQDLAQTWMNYYLPSQNAWSWDSGVMMMGFLDLWEATDNLIYYQYAKDWLDHHIRAGYHISASDMCIPGYASLYFYNATGDKKYLDVADDVWHYITETAGRTSDGGLNHMGWMTGNQMWIDTLFMVGPFMIRYAEVTGKDEPLEELVIQLEAFRKRLRDPGTGLYRHMYDDDLGEVTPKEGLFWGRGNGWVFAALNLANQELPESIKSRLSFDLESDLAQMYLSITESETVSGRFHTIINRNDTYPETSAALLFAYGLALRQRHYNDFPLAMRANFLNWLQGAVDQVVVDDNGDTLLLGVSYGTSPGGVEYYQQVLKGENVAYGMGLFLLAASRANMEEYYQGLDFPLGESGEDFMRPPVPCDGVRCGKFHISRGNYIKGKEAFEKVLAVNPSDARAHFYNGLIDLIRFGIEAVFNMDMIYIGDIDIADFIQWLNTDGVNSIGIVQKEMSEVIADNGFTSNLERLVIIESGGHNAIGAREFDLGEAYIVKGLAEIIKGAAYLVGADPSMATSLPKTLDDFENEIMVVASGNREKGIKDSIHSLKEGVLSLINGIDYIMGETDHQSDDFIPKNLLQLTGTFSIPGLLVETDVIELLAGLGLPKSFLLSLDMPDDLIWFLETVFDILDFIDRVFLS